MTIFSIYFAPWFIAWFYKLPMFLCAIGYTVATTLNVLADIDRRARDGKNYVPAARRGDVAARIFVTFCPVVNILLLVGDLGKELLDYVAEKICRWADRPLVPRLKK